MKPNNDFSKLSVTHSGSNIDVDLALNGLEGNSVLEAMNNIQNTGGIFTSSSKGLIFWPWHRIYNCQFE